MKKILIFIVLSLSLINLKAQISGAGGGGGRTEAQIGTQIEDSLINYLPKANPEYTGTLTVGSAVLEETEQEILDGATLSTTELNYVDGVTSNIQTQLEDTVAAVDEVFMLADSNSYGGATTWPAYLKAPSNDNMMKAGFEDGSVILAVPIGIANYFSYIGLSDAAPVWVKFRITDTITTTGVKYCLQTAGNFTADASNNIAIYSVSGTTYTLIDTTRNSGDIWKTTAYTIGTETWTDGPHKLSPGIYLIAGLYNQSAQTTAPQIYYCGFYGTGAISLLLGGDNPLAAIDASQSKFADSYSKSDMQAYQYILFLVPY